MPLHIDLTQLRLESAPFRLKQYVKINLPQWINQTIVDSIKIYAIASGAPSNYMEHVKVVRISDFVYAVDLDWVGPKNEPLGLWWEKGTKAHRITAVVADFLHWVSKTTGKDVFRKMVKHPGTKPHNIMKNAAKHGIPRLENMIIENTNQFLEVSRMT